MKLFLNLAVVALMFAGIHASPKCSKKHFVYLTDLKDGCSHLPPNWHKINQWCRDTPENRQSPIVLDERSCSKNISGLKLEGFDQSMTYSYVNNGHSVSFTPTKAGTMTVSGGNLQTTYQLLSFHFHWGKKNSRTGSEHRIVGKDGKEYPTSMELHMVFYQKGISFKEATTTKEGLAVIAVLFQSRSMVSSRNSNRSRSQVRGIEKNLSLIRKHLRNVKNPAGHGASSSHTMDLKLADFLPSDERLKFLNYDGSLTTPGCNPVVQWNVLHPPVTVKADLIAEFSKKLTYNGEENMYDNNRPVQKLHGRQIRCN